VKRAIVSCMAALALTVLGVGVGGADSIPAKLKSKKVQGDLVRAFKGDSSSLIATAEKKTLDADGEQHCLGDPGKKCFCESDSAPPTGMGRCKLQTAQPCDEDSDCAFAGDFCTKGCREDTECGLGSGEACCGNDDCTGIDAGNSCEFEKGTFKTQIGKSTQFQLSKVRCER